MLARAYAKAEPTMSPITRPMAAGRFQLPLTGAGGPTARIDYLFVSQDVRPLRAWVSTAPDVVTASDHRPVFAELELEGAKVNP